MSEGPSESCFVLSDPVVGLLSVEDEATGELDGSLVSQSKSEHEGRSEKHRFLHLEQNSNNENITETASLANEGKERIQPLGASFQLGDDGICAECHKLFEEVAKVMVGRSDVPSYNFNHYKKAIEIQQSSENGCRTCTLLIEAYGYESFERDYQVPEAIGNVESPEAPQIWLGKPSGSDAWTIGLQIIKPESLSRSNLDWDTMMRLFPTVEGSMCYV
jgi:hypothetical protein